MGVLADDEAATLREGVVRTADVRILPEEAINDTVGGVDARLTDDNRALGVDVFGCRVRTDKRVWADVGARSDDRTVRDKDRATDDYTIFGGR